MFNSLLPVELGVHATAWDLTGVKELTARIAPFAERHPGWVPIRQISLYASADQQQRGHALSTRASSPARRSS